MFGQGGFGITYRAHDTQVHRDVAIKEYLPTAFALRDPDSMVLPRSTHVAEDFRWGRDRFLAEARTLARLDQLRRRKNCRQRRHGRGGRGSLARWRRFVR